MNIPREFFPLMVPRYLPIRHGNWQLAQVQTGCPVVGGYFQQRVRFSPTHWALLKGQKTWMSTTPFELQSQGYHANLATGWVVVAGLGMGVLTWNLLKNSRVTKITVLEIDSEVIQLIKLAAPWFSEAIDSKKVELIQGDAFDYKPEGKPDLLVADIWPGVGRTEAESDTLRLQQNVKAETIAWWGQELAFGSWCNSRKLMLPFTSNQLREYATGLAEKGEGCRLLGANHPEYPKMATEAVRTAITALSFGHSGAFGQQNS